ncbi:MAG: exo-alpha-sialidase [Chloroflexi bacterium]|nr:exo-alpha-sialidase [Chloroflexota bacterium]
MKGKPAFHVQAEGVIVSGRQPRYRAFPALEQLANGDLLLAYRDGRDHHATCDGAILTVRSRDQGHTWDDPIAVVADPGWDCTTVHGMTQLSDGTCILYVWKSRWLGEPFDQSRRVAHLFLARSPDGGQTWQPLEPAPEVPFLTDVGWRTPYGRIHKLSSGALLMPFYGFHRDRPEAWSSVILFSYDWGQTWPDYTIVASDPGQDRKYRETDMVRLPDGRFFAVIREETPPYPLYRSYSGDDGRTWSLPERVGLMGQGPSLVALASGAILLTYRDRQDAGHIGLAGAVSYDAGQTWDYLGRFYDAGEVWQCCYSSIVQLPDGRVFCAFHTGYLNGNSEIRGLYLEEVRA